jgi:dephospho-CoA kinase
MQRFESDPGITVIVLDSPLLFESGLDKLCDAVVFVEVDEDVRLERARDRRGWDPDEIRRREQFQLPLDIKRSRADYLVQNNSDIHALRRQVERVYQQIAFSARPGA